VLGSSLHLIHLLLLDHPFEIFNWPDWHGLFFGLPEGKRAVALEVPPRSCCMPHARRGQPLPPHRAPHNTPPPPAACRPPACALPLTPASRLSRQVGASPDYLNRMLSGARPVEEQSKAHNRFAAACVLDMIICEGHVSVVEEQWGRPGALTRQGVSRGQLQKLQVCVCVGCEWWVVGAVLWSHVAPAGIAPLWLAVRADVQACKQCPPPLPPLPVSVGTALALVARRPPTAP
jgi:hypothetical protein